MIHIHDAVLWYTTNYGHLHSYTDTVGKRALVHRFTIANLTIEACAATCAANNYGLAGLEYGQECYCGMSFTGTRRHVL